MEQIKITYDENHEQPVVSSLQVAEDFGKRHDKLISEIERMYKPYTNEGYAENGGDPLFYKTTYINEQNKQSYPIYLMNRDGFSLLVMGFTGKNALDWKIKYIQAFNQMEKQIKTNLLEKPENIIKALLQSSDNNHEEIKAVKQELRDHEENHELTRGEYSYLSGKVSARLAQVKTAREWHLNLAQSGILKHGINGDICRYMGVRTRTMIARKDFEKACQFVEGWDPSSVTLEKIKELEE